jgi:16S rRNA processing protein RimM
MTGPGPSFPEKQPAGSPDEGEPVFLVIGKLRRPHGIHGEILMDIITDFPERLNAGNVVFVGEDHQATTVRSLRKHGRALLLAFEAYHSPESVAELRNQLVFVRAENLPTLPEGEYYHHELIGLRVVDEAGELLGVVTQILDTGANDVYIIRPVSGPEILLPAIDSVILNIDLHKAEIQVHILPGLIPD